MLRGMKNGLYLLPATSVVAKKLRCRLKNKLRQLKEGAKSLTLSEEVPVVLYRVITGQKYSWRLPLFQPENFTLCYLPT